MTEQVRNPWVVAAESASLRYPGSAPPDALVGVDLAVGRGELVAITGRSGSGKSSLLSLLGLLEQPTAGEICFDGEPTSGMSDRERAGIRSRRLGFVFQDHLVAPHLTVRENLELALVQRRVARRHRSREAERVLGFVSLRHKADALGRQLSGGERQRTSIARAVIGSPDLLLCDEPTGNLDTGNAEHVIALLRGAVEGAASVVVVTHDPVVASSADRIVTLVDGEVRRG